MGPFCHRKRLQNPIYFKASSFPNSDSLRQSNISVLEEEVQLLLDKGAMEHIKPEVPGFYSRIFLVPKKNGKLTLIIDLSRLNIFVDVQGKWKLK